MSSIFHLPSILFVVNASSLLMYFSTLNKRSAIVVSGVLAKEKIKSLVIRHGWKAIN